MTDKNLPTQDELTTILGDFQPVPSDNFHAKMDDAPWQDSAAQNGRRITILPFTTQKLATIAAIFALIMIGTVVLYPTIRAIAQGTSRFFDRDDNDVYTFEYTVPTNIPAAQGTPYNIYTSPREWYPNTVEESNTQAGIEAQAPQLMPDDLRFIGSQANDQSIILLFQSPHRFPQHTETSYMRVWDPNANIWFGSNVGQSATVETVQIGELEGEYVEGTYVGTETDQEWAPGATISQQYEWDERAGARLIWEDNGLRYEIDPFHQMSRENVINIARCMYMPYDILEPDYFLVGLRRHFDNKDIVCDLDNQIAVQTFIARGHFIQLRQLPLERTFNAVIDPISTETTASEILDEVTVIQGEWIGEIGDDRLLNDLEPTAIGVQWQTDSFQFELWSVGAGRGLPDIGVEQLLELAGSLE